MADAPHGPEDDPGTDDDGSDGPDRRLADGADDVEGDPGLPPEGDDPMDGAAPSG